jgi:hypothetical protein
LLYCDGFYLSNDYETLNGLGLMRKKILERLSSNIKYIDVNLIKLERMETREQKHQYLVSLGLDWLEN